MNNTNWTKSEERLLRQVFRMTPHSYTRYYQSTAVVMGYQKRSLKAIQNKLKNMGLSKAKNRRRWNKKEFLILSNYLHYPVTEYVTLCQDNGLNRSFQAIATTYYRVKNNGTN